jgi:hypothetical protein
VGSIDGRVARVAPGRIGIAFDGHDNPARDRLIARLFTEGRSNQVDAVPLWAATRALLASIWRADARAVAPPPAQLPEPEERLDKRTRVIPPAARQQRAA